MRDFKTMNMHDRKIEQRENVRKAGQNYWLVIVVVVVGVVALIWLLSRL
jgi:hypothetical protein